MGKKVSLLVVFFCFIFSSLTFAHSGRTDSSGGHNCSAKSQAKGLCTGYHNHNGGGSSNSGGGGGSSSGGSNAGNDKDCTDFASYDEMVEYWNSKGYSATYDPENLDGWGNGRVDDGIPCEAPDGYDKTKINNSPEQAAHKEAKYDNDAGQKQGYKKGLKDGFTEGANNSQTDGTDAFKEGFVIGYKKGYEEGKSKIETEKTKAAESGYVLGNKQGKFAIPGAYSSNAILKKAFEEGFNKSMYEQEELKKKEFNQLGYENGLKDIYSIPKNVDADFIRSYEEGYNRGQEELKEKYKKQGYKAAYKMLKYKAPKLANAKFIKWYKEGFESNEKVVAIKNAGLTLGREGADYHVPEKYADGEIIFKHYYQAGLSEYELEKSGDHKAALSGLGITSLLWFGRRYYVAKKMVG